MNTAKENRPDRAFTLMEVLMVSVIASVILLFLFNFMRHVGTGMTKIQRVVPLQRDLQMAKQVIEKDLLSAPRSSIGTTVPNPGFENEPASISTFTPTTPNFWACLPLRPRWNPLNAYGLGYLSSRNNFYLNGHFGLTINIQNEFIPYMAMSSTFSLISGTDYLLGGWINNQKSVLPPGIYLYGDSSPWPSAFLRSVTSSLASWNFVVCTFTGNGSFNYRLGAGYIRGVAGHHVASFDDIIVTPLLVNLTPSNGASFSFDRFQQGDDPSLSQRALTRYRLIPRGASGQLIREQYVGGGWVTLTSLENVRRLSIGWDFGQSIPGTLPPPATWPTLFAKGMNFPLSITMESGDVGATGDKTLSLTFSVFPAVP